MLLDIVSFFIYVLVQLGHSMGGESLTAGEQFRLGLCWAILIGYFTGYFVLRIVAAWGEIN